MFAEKNGNGLPVPPERWNLYKSVITEAAAHRIPFAVGGGLAAMTYAGQWRDSKDMDLYIFAHDRERMIDVLTRCGLSDYFERLGYDRRWIYRSYRDDSIVDIMWSMANQRASVDSEWLHGPEVIIDGLQIRLVPPEETLWSKLYVLQHDRCDWPDAMSMLCGIGASLDWERLLARVGDDALLLGGLLNVFRWICPHKARLLPAWIWHSLGLAEIQTCEVESRDSKRWELLDSRPWFAPAIQTFEGRK